MLEVNETAFAYLDTSGQFSTSHSLQLNYKPVRPGYQLTTRCQGKSSHHDKLGDQDSELTGLVFVEAYCPHQMLNWESMFNRETDSKGCAHDDFRLLSCLCLGCMAPPNFAYPM